MGDVVKRNKIYNISRRKEKRIFPTDIFVAR